MKGFGDEQSDSKKHPSVLLRRDSKDGWRELAVDYLPDDVEDEPADGLPPDTSEVLL